MTDEATDMLRGVVLGACFVFLVLYCFDKVFYAGIRLSRKWEATQPKDIFTDARSTTPASPKLEDFDK